jgi:hypothetical protein
MKTRAPLNRKVAPADLALAIRLAIGAAADGGATGRTNRAPDFFL